MRNIFLYVSLRKYVDTYQALKTYPLMWDYNFVLLRIYIVLVVIYLATDVSRILWFPNVMIPYWNRELCHSCPPHQSRDICSKINHNQNKRKDHAMYM